MFFCQIQNCHLCQNPNSPILRPSRNVWLLLKPFPAITAPHAKSFKRLNSGAFFKFSTLEHILSYSGLCWLILLQSGKSSGCHERAIGTSAGEKMWSIAFMFCYKVLMDTSARSCAYVWDAWWQSQHPTLIPLLHHCTHWSWRVLCHISPKRSWTVCFVVHMHTHTHAHLCRSTEPLT